MEACPEKKGSPRGHYETEALRCCWSELNNAGSGESRPGAALLDMPLQSEPMYAHAATSETGADLPQKEHVNVGCKA